LEPPVFDQSSPAVLYGDLDILHRVDNYGPDHLPTLFYEQEILGPDRADCSRSFFLSGQKLFF
jgi:hypothetical protein